MVYSDNLNYIFPMKQSGLKTSISVENYDEETAENYQNCYFAKKCIVHKIPDFHSRNRRLK